MSNTTKTQKNDIDTCIRVFKIGRVALAAVIIAGLVNAVDFTTYAAALRTKVALRCYSSCLS